MLSSSIQFKASVPSFHVLQLSTAPRWRRRRKQWFSLSLLFSCSVHGFRSPSAPRNQSRLPAKKTSPLSNVRSVRSWRLSCATKCRRSKPRSPQRRCLYLLGVSDFLLNAADRETIWDMISHRFCLLFFCDDGGGRYPSMRLLRSQRMCAT